MASLAEMERELIVERTRAGLEVAKQLGRKGGRKPKMTDSKIESAKKLLASGVPPKDVARTLACRFRRSTTGCQPPRTLSVLYFPFSETTPNLILPTTVSALYLRRQVMIGWSNFQPVVKTKVSVLLSMYMHNWLSNVV